jgi:hypothetical protein
MLPVILVLATTIVTGITQRIWLTKSYLILFIVAICYSIFGLWLVNFDFASSIFRFSLIPFLYIFLCYIFHFLFRKIKPKSIERNFPIYVHFIDITWTEYWSKKIVGDPVDLDKRISNWLNVIAVFSMWFLIAI